MNTPPNPAFQASARPRLRPGCPITRDEIIAVRRIRQAMLDYGYRPLAIHSPWSPFVEPANAGKQPLTEVTNGQKLPWTRGHSRDRLTHVAPMSANTGLVLGGAAALIALDLDPSKGASAAEQQAFGADVLRLLRRDPLC